MAYMIRLFIYVIMSYGHSKTFIYKKVLLREYKRHTDRSVSSTTRWGTPYPPSQVWWGVHKGGYPPIRVPPAKSDRGVPEVGYLPSVRVPPTQVWWGYLRWGTPNGVPPWPGLTGGTWGGVPPPGPGWGTPPAWTWLGYPSCLDLVGVPPHPPVWTDRWMDGWMDRHVWKHYLPVVLRTRSVNIYLVILSLFLWVTARQNWFVRHGQPARTLNWIRPVLDVSCPTLSVRPKERKSNSLSCDDLGPSADRGRMQPQYSGLVVTACSLYFLICHRFFFFFLNFWRTRVLFVGPLIPLFWTSDDVSPGFQSQGRSLACVLCRLLS